MSSALRRMFVSKREPRICCGSARVSLAVDIMAYFELAIAFVYAAAAIFLCDVGTGWGNLGIFLTVLCYLVLVWAATAVHIAVTNSTPLFILPMFVFNVLLLSFITSMAIILSMAQWPNYQRMADNLLWLPAILFHFWYMILLRTCYHYIMDLKTFKHDQCNVLSALILPIFSSTPHDWISYFPAKR